MVVTVGVAVTVAPVDALRPVVGNQLYPTAPADVIPVEEAPPPEHNEGLVAVAVTVGTVFTVIN